MKEVRCPVCGALWFKMLDGHSIVDMKCRKCGHTFTKEITVIGEKVVMCNAVQKGQKG